MGHDDDTKTPRQIPTVRNLAPPPASPPTGIEVPAELPTGPEHETPTLGEPNRRSDNPTVPGGGANRMSGGREAASVYVGVRTVAPTAPLRERTVTRPIKLDPGIEAESRRHATEPSMPRVWSTAPPPNSNRPRLGSRPSLLPRARFRAVALLVGGLALAVGILLALLLAQPTGESTPWDHGLDGHPGSLEQVATEKGRATPTPPKQTVPADFHRNEDAARPREPELAQPASPPPVEEKAAITPSPSTPQPSPAKSPSTKVVPAKQPAPSPSTKPTADTPDPDPRSTTKPSTTKPSTTKPPTTKPPATNDRPWLD